MLDFLEKHLEFTLSGVGAVLMAIIGGYIKYRYDLKLKKVESNEVAKPTQSVRAGNRSVIHQAGGDMSISASASPPSRRKGRKG